MNSKTITILVFMSILIMVIGTVHSVTLGYSGQADPIRGFSIENVEFNIPEGYVKNNVKSIVNETGNNGNCSFIVNQETYENSNGEEIILSVVDYDAFDMDASNLYRICNGADAKKLKGYSGYLRVTESFCQFTYAFDNKEVSIKAPDEYVINQVLVVEDA